MNKNVRGFARSSIKPAKRKTEHHRKAKSSGGSNNPLNILLVSKAKHQAFHTLFGVGDPKHIEYELNHIWIDPAYIVTIKLINK